MSNDDKEVPAFDQFTAVPHEITDDNKAFQIVAAICMQSLGIEANKFGRDFQAQNLTADQVWDALRTVRACVERKVTKFDMYI